MHELLKNKRVLLMLSVLAFSLILISFNGIKFGIDFRGGTLFQIHLAEPVANADEMAKVRATIEQRLDWTGLKDTRVTSWGDEFIIAEMAETDPGTIETLEGLLRRQGRFEVTLNGELIFTGSDLVHISKDAAKGYGIAKQTDSTFSWRLPFVLTESAGRAFSYASFHKCTIISYDAAAGNEYDCDRTYFFVDRPVDSIIVMPYSLYSDDKEMFSAGNFLQNIPADTDIDELLENIALQHFIVVDQNLSAETLAEIAEAKAENKFAIVPETLSKEIKDKLAELGYKLKESPLPKEVPWLWQASGARQIISLSEDIAGMEPYIAKKEDAQIFTDLIIRGAASDEKTAAERLSSLTVLLESGSLPVAVDSVSKETISAFLGKEFLQDAFIIGFFALIAVALVLFIRYRILKLTIPIMSIVLSEVIIILGLSSLFSWRIDLAAVAGILAVLGTGVDDQIVITDELLKGELDEISISLLSRTRRAFFIVFAAAATVIAAMLPLIIFGSGMSKLVGFAIATILGVLIGVIVTRPAYGEIVRYILTTQEAKPAQKKPEPQKGETKNEPAGNSSTTELSSS